nr:hypothetical protein [Tanacetum cinerariifolium]
MFRARKVITVILSVMMSLEELERALNHYAMINEFEYLIEKSEPTRFTARCANLSCKWEIHAHSMEDGITFKVKNLVEEHFCIQSNKGGNKHATQGWIADVVSDKLKSNGDVPVLQLSKRLMKHYNVDLPYQKVFRGKEQAYTDIHGKWEDSFLYIDDFKEELQKKNSKSIVDIEFERNGNKKCFQRFFISLLAYSMGFLAVVVLAYGILELENTQSWIWFLELLKKTIGTPDGLVISLDMQKGLEVAITQVYPNVEHRECIRHLYRNFKKIRKDFFNIKFWGAARTYCINEHDRLLNEIAGVSEEAITYLHDHHKKIWSRCKFGTSSKCDYITNNISEAFNSWVGDLRYQPVLTLLDGIRGRLMNLGWYEVCRSSDNRAEVKHKGKCWEVILDERKCTCRVCQVRGLPCVHAVAFISFMRDNNWDKFVDPYFTIEKLKEAYALEIAPLPTKDQWLKTKTDEKIYPHDIC